MSEETEKALRSLTDSIFTLVEKSTLTREETKDSVFAILRAVYVLGKHVKDGK